jgi:hypothetical protein
MYKTSHAVVTRLLPILLMLSVPAFAADKPAPKQPDTREQRAEPKPVYRTLDKMLKEFRREAEAKLIATR